MYAMKQFTLPLDNETQRPITFLQNWHGLDAMIDTGSLFPVWADDENHAFNVTIPDNQSNVRNLVIKDCGGKLHVLCTPAEIVS